MLIYKLFLVSLRYGEVIGSLIPYAAPRGNQLFYPTQVTHNIIFIFLFLFLLFAHHLLHDICACFIAYTS
ncbi:hypothetical protein LguiA_030072 [Lonicera macranthoides]